MWLQDVHSWYPLEVEGVESNVLLSPDRPASPARSAPHRSTVRVGEFEVAMGGGVWVATRGLDLPTGSVRRPRYSQAQKVRAIEHHLENGRSATATITGVGLSLKGIAACMGHGVASGDACARRWPMPGADACNEAVGRHRLVHATSKREGGGSSVGRVSVVVKPVVAWNEVKQSDDEGFSEVLIFPD